MSICRVPRGEGKRLCRYSYIYTDFAAKVRTRIYGLLSSKEEVGGPSNPIERMIKGWYRVLANVTGRKLFYWKLYGPGSTCRLCCHNTGENSNQDQIYVVSPTQEETDDRGIVYQVMMFQFFTYAEHKTHNESLRHSSSFRRRDIFCI